MYEPKKISGYITNLDIVIVNLKMNLQDEAEKLHVALSKHGYTQLYLFTTI